MHYFGNILRPWPRDYTDKNDETLETPIGNLDFIMTPRVVYRYLSIERAVSTLEKRSLWFSSPDNFNDPFDMHVGLLDFKLNKERAKNFTNRNKQDMSRANRRAYTKDVLKRAVEFTKYQVELFNTTKTESGVCCFSAKSDVALMWSHYADSHRGVVLGFNIEPVFTDYDQFMMMQKVRYAHEIKAKNIYDLREDALMDWVLTKSTIWSYEHEIRAFCFKRNGFQSFDASCLKEIYFGCNAKKEDIISILNLIEEQNYKQVALHNMVIDSKKFDIKSESYNTGEKKKEKK